MDIPKFETPDFELYKVGIPINIWRSFLDIPASMNSMQKVGVSAVVAGVGLDNLDQKLTVLNPLFMGTERSAHSVVNSFFKRYWKNPEVRPSRRSLVNTGAATLVLLKGIGSMAASRDLPPEVFGSPEGAVSFDIPEERQDRCAEVLQEITDVLSVRWNMTDESGLGNSVTVTSGTKDEPNRRWVTAQVLRGSVENQFHLELSGVRPVHSSHGQAGFPKALRQMGKTLLVGAGREITSTS